MKSSFTTLGCPDWSTEEIARRAKEYGYDGIELRTADDRNHLSPDAGAAELDRIRKQFADSGVAIMSVLGYASFASLDPNVVEKGAATLRKNISIAQELGTPFIRAYAGRLPKDSDRTAIAKAIIGALKPLADEAAKAKVRIGIETHDDWCPGEYIMSIINGVASPSVGIVYDIFNSFLDGREPWETTYGAIKAHIVYCHLKDGYRKADGKVRYVFIGAGDLPIRDILARMKADGYSGYLSFEWEKKWIPDLEPPEVVLPHYAHKLRSLWNSL